MTKKKIDEIWNIKGRAKMDISEEKGMDSPELDQSDYIRVIQDFKSGRISIEDVKDFLPAELVGLLGFVKDLPDQMCLSAMMHHHSGKDIVTKIVQNVYNRERPKEVDESQPESNDDSTQCILDNFTDSDYMRVITDWKEGKLFHTNVVQILSKQEVDMLNEAKDKDTSAEALEFLKMIPNSKEIIIKIYQKIYNQEKQKDKTKDFYRSTIINFVRITGGETVCRKNGEKMTPLAEAALIGNIEQVQSLLDTPGINVNALHERDDSNSTPLMLAAIGNHPDVAKLLIDKGADINMINKPGDTALSLAARRGNRSVVELLLENKADMEIKGESDQPAVVAAREGIGRYMSYYTRARRKERKETLQYLQDEIFKDLENEPEAESGDEECDINDVETEEENPFKAVYSRGVLYEVDQKNMTDSFFYNAMYLTTN